MGKKNRRQKRRKKRGTLPVSVAPPIAQKVTVGGGDAKRSKESTWLKPIAIGVVSALIASVALIFTPVLHSRLSVVDAPAVVYQSAVYGDEHQVRHMAQVHFCVRNRGLIEGNVSRVVVNAVGLAEIPTITVQELDRAPVSAFHERTVSTKIMLDDRLALSDKATMKVDVYDEADRWAGNFALELERPFKFEQHSDGSRSVSASVTAGPVVDACPQPHKVK